MPTYILLAQWTQAGIEHIQGLQSRIESLRALLKSLDGELKAIYWTLGRFDTIAIVEVPSDEALGKVLLDVGKAGNVRTESLRAFSEAEIYPLIQELA